MEGFLPSERKELKELEEMDLILNELYKQYKSNKSREFAFGQFMPLIQPRYPDLHGRDLEEKIRDLFYKLDDREVKHIDLSKTARPAIKLNPDGEKFLLDNRSYVRDFFEKRAEKIEQKKERKQEKKSKKVDLYLKYLSIPATIIAIGSGLSTCSNDREIDELKTRIEKLEKINHQKDN